MRRKIDVRPLLLPIFYEMTIVNTQVRNGFEGANIRLLSLSLGRITRQIRNACGEVSDTVDVVLGTPNAVLVSQGLANGVGCFSRLDSKD